MEQGGLLHLPWIQSLGLFLGKPFTLIQRGLESISYLFPILFVVLRNWDDTIGSRFGVQICNHGGNVLRIQSISNYTCLETMGIDFSLTLGNCVSINSLHSIITQENLAIGIYHVYQCLLRVFGTCGSEIFLFLFWFLETIAQNSIEIEHHIQNWRSCAPARYHNPSAPLLRAGALSNKMGGKKWVCRDQQTSSFS